MHAAVSGRCVYNVCVLPRLVLSVQCADGREDWGGFCLAGTRFDFVFSVLFYFILFLFLFLIFSGRFR